MIRWTLTDDGLYVPTIEEVLPMSLYSQYNPKVIRNESISLDWKKMELLPIVLTFYDRGSRFYIHLIEREGRTFHNVLQS